MYYSRFHHYYPRTFCFKNVRIGADPYNTEGENPECGAMILKKIALRIPWIITPVRYYK